MKLFVLILTALISYIVSAQELKFDKVVKNGIGKTTAAQAKLGNRYIAITIPEIRNDSTTKTFEKEKALNNPFLVFKDRAEQDLNTFIKFSKEIKSCVEGKKWPFKASCLEKIPYCFNDPETRYSGHKACDVWKSDYIEEICNRTRLDLCLQNVEKAFDVLVGCFENDTYLKLKYVSSKNKDFNWDQEIFMIISDSNKEDMPQSSECVFTYFNSSFSLIEIRNIVDVNDSIKFIVPDKK